MYNHDRAVESMLSALEGEHVFAPKFDVEPSMTLLAEWYADQQSSWSWLDDPDHDIWYAAYCAVEAYEKNHK